MALQVDQLRWMAERHGDETAYAQLASTDLLTFARWDATSNRLARGLTAAGVGRGDRVALHLEQRAPRPLGHQLRRHPQGRRGGRAHQHPPHGPRARRRSSATPSRRAAITSRALRPALDEALAAPTGAGPPARVIDADDRRRGDRRSTADDDRPTRCRWATATWPTSCTPRAPPGCPRAWPSATATPTSSPTASRAGPATRGSTARRCPTFAGISFVYNPMKMGMRGPVPAPLRRRTPGSTPSSSGARRWPSWCRPWCSCCWPTTAFAGADLSSLTLLSIGSAPLPPTLHRQVAERLPDAMVTNNYSMTEAGTAFTYLPPGEITRRPGLGGHAAAAHRDPHRRRATARPCPAGETGEVLIGVGEHHREYYRDPRPPRARGRASGCARATWATSTRTATSTSSGGPRTSSSGAATTSPPPRSRPRSTSTRACSRRPWSAIPHDVLGEDVGAFVVRPARRRARRRRAARPSAPSAWPTTRCPATIWFLDELPRNATGKVLKRELPRLTLRSASLGGRFAIRVSSAERHRSAPPRRAPASAPAPASRPSSSRKAVTSATVEWGLSPAARWPAFSTTSMRASGMSSIRSSAPVLGQHVALLAPQQQHGAGELGRRLAHAGRDLVDVVGRVGLLLAGLAPLADLAAHRVLPLPAAVGALAEVAGQRGRVGGAALGQVLADGLGRLVERGERLVGGHEVDDLAHAFGLEPVAHVDQDDARHPLGRHVAGQVHGASCRPARRPPPPTRPRPNSSSSGRLVSANRSCIG